jgi:hypothetical protein
VKCNNKTHSKQVPKYDKLAKLLRLACSNGPDGEKLAAISRLRELVAAQDLDWDTVLGANPELTRAQLQDAYNAGIAAGAKMERESRSSGVASDWRNAGLARTNEVGVRWGEVEEILNAADEAIADGWIKRSSWYVDSGFLANVRENLERYGANCFISEKQWAKLDQLREDLEFGDYL